MGTLSLSINVFNPQLVEFADIHVPSVASLVTTTTDPLTGANRVL